jgi:hypothetical protein
MLVHAIIRAAGAALGSGGDPSPPPAGYYVAPGGDDGNPGTFAQPWATLAFALTQLAPGEHLWIRGGRYREAPLASSLSGTPGNRIGIHSYPGEVAIIDAALAEFQTVGNDAWVLHDAATETYRSVGASYPAGATWIGSFVTSDGDLYRMFLYGSLAHLMSTSYTYDPSGAYYRGPGFVRHSDGRIYIRLQNLAAPRDAGVPAAAPSDHPIRNTPPSTAGFDPRQHRINLSTVGDLLTLSGAHVYWERIAFEGGDRGIVLNTASHQTFERCRISGQRIAFRFNSGNNSIHVLKSDIDNGFPPYISWNEVKTNDPVAPGMKISLATTDENNHDILFEDNRFRRCFDGMAGVRSTMSNIRFLHNTWDFLFDDAVQFDNGVTEFEFGWNFVNGPGPGYNGGGDPAEPHSKWWHHNVIDVRRDEFGRRVGQGGDGTEWRRAHAAFPTHSVNGNTPVKIYNNTILMEQNINNTGARLERVGDTTLGVHEAWNNIVLQYDDREYVRSVKAGAFAIYDYNLFWKFHPGTFARFNDYPPTDANPGTDYASLAAWRASAGFASSKAYYAPGYEAHSKEADPQFGPQANPTHRDYRPAPSGPAASGAADLSSTGWPGATAADWFGAVDPDAPTGLGAVGARVLPGP